MKTNLLFFGLGCIFIASIAAAPVVQDLIAVKPALPKTVIVRDGLYDVDANKFILKGHKDGYVLKSIAGVSPYIIVMEKY